MCVKRAYRQEDDRHFNFRKSVEALGKRGVVEHEERVWEGRMPTPPPKWSL